MFDLSTRIKIQYKLVFVSVRFANGGQLQCKKKSAI